MYQLCVSEQATSNVTEHLTDGITENMPLIKQLQNTVNYPFLYVFINVSCSGVGNPLG